MSPPPRPPIDACAVDVEGSDVKPSTRPVDPVVVVLVPVPPAPGPEAPEGADGGDPLIDESLADPHAAVS